MKDSKKIKRNLIIGVLGQVVTLVLGIAVPKLVLTSYGSEVNGLLSSITNIYAYIAMVEAGVAAASCQALYKAIANQDRDNINSVLSATNKYYHRTGFIYLLLILLFSAIYPIVVKTDIPFYAIVLIILFNGVGNVVNYFFHGKYLILLKADGKNYIRTGIEIFTSSAKQIAKIVFIALGYDVVMVQFVAMLVSFAQMAYITYYIKKKYSWLDLSVAPDYKSISQSKNVIVHQINYLITSNTDTVLLTAFATLKTVSVYSIYILLFNMVEKVLHVLRDAVEFKIANYFYASKTKFLTVFRAYEIYYTAFSFALYSVADYFVHPFLKLYTSDVTDINYIVKFLPLLFAFTKLGIIASYPCDAMVHISGHFKQTQTATTIESIINVALSLVLVINYGIAGVLIGTILSTLFRVVYRIVYIHKNVIEGKRMFGSFKTVIVNFATFALVDIAGNAIKVDLSSYFKIVLFCIPFSLTVMAIYFVINSVFEPQSYLFLKSGLLKTLKKRSK